MKRFEYVNLSSTELNDRKNSYYLYNPEDIYSYKSLNHFGENGWELISIVPDLTNGGYMYFFKKEL